MCSSSKCNNNPELVYQNFWSLTVNLQHLRSARLAFSVISDDVRLERDLFLNLGQVQNLTIDLSGSTSNSPNHTTAELANPATKYKVGIPNSVFLVDLNLGEKAYPCSCYSLGYGLRWEALEFQLIKYLPFQMACQMAPEKAGTALFFRLVYRTWRNYFKV